MARKKVSSSTALLVGGVLTLGIGQYAYWTLPRVASPVSAGSRQEIQPDFIIKETETAPLPGGTESQGILRVLLVNQLDRPVTVFLRSQRRLSSVGLLRGFESAPRSRRGRVVLAGNQNRLAGRPR